MENYGETLELIWDGKAELGEGPAWDARTGSVLWVDIMQKRVYLLQTAENRLRTIQLDQRVGAAVPNASGGLTLALQDGFYQLDLETEQLAKLHDPEPDLPGSRFNDGKCDASGRFFAGTMDLTEKRPVGSLYCLEKDGSVRRVLSGVTTSNGLGWSPDGQTMYYIDSPTCKVDAFDYEPAAGALTNRRPVVTIPEGGGFPDGMTVDEEGMLWVAQWSGWQVSRWDPRTGALLGVIRLPVERVTSCAFGGPALDELYITTARPGAEAAAAGSQPAAGGLFRCKPGVKGAPTFSYGG